ncbi:MAG: hypothetical protein IJ856_04830 [Candidatus Methanomethylophilaceae archaeon]|nr:hypothetical protein [Candidatus Methanomethylophilaceae archaeon]
MDKAWSWVLAGGIVEATYTTLMGMADGLSDLLTFSVGFVFSIIGTLLLNGGLKRGLPVGASYAVWVGVGVVGASLMDILVFDNGPGVLGYLCLALALGGVVGINVSSDRATAEKG